MKRILAERMADRENGKRKVRYQAMKALEILTAPLTLRWPVYAICAVVVFATILQFSAAAPVLEPDSGSYLGFSSFTPIGYPLFLATLQYIGLDLYNIVLIQCAIYSISIVFLSSRICQQFGALAAIFIIFFLTLAIPIVNYQFTILSEGIWISFLVLLMAILLDLSKSPNTAKILLASLILAIMTSIRISTISFVLPISLILLCSTSTINRRWLVGLLFFSFTIFFAAERFAHGWIHQNDSKESQISILVFAKGVMVDDRRPSEETKFPKLTDQVNKEFSQIYNYLNNSNGFATKSFLLIRYEAYSHFRYRPPEIKNLIQKYNLEESDILFQFGVDRLLGNPIQALSNHALNYIGMWKVYRVSTPHGARQLQSFVDEFGPLKFSDLYKSLAPTPTPQLFGLVIQISMLLIGFVFLCFTVYAIVAIVRGKRFSPVETYLCALVFATQSSFILISGINTPIERFTVAHFPLIVVVTIVCAACLAKKSIKKIRY